MAISKITYKQNFAYNPIQMEHIHLGVEIDINEGEDPVEAFNSAKELVNETYQSIIKSMPVPLYEDHKVPDKQVDKLTDKIKPLIEELEACTTYADIQSFRFTVKNDAEKAVYERKLEELSPKNQ